MMDFTNALTLVAGCTGSISGTVSSIQGLRELLKTSDNVDPTVLKELLAIYDKLLSTQSSYVSLQAELAALQRESEKMRGFEQEMERYSLYQAELGGLVYKLKESHANGEPVHYLCPKCKEDKVKSILQPRRNNKNCPRCETIYSFKPVVASNERSQQSKMADWSAKINR